jgi:putative flavoprotein involved in K+ transport
VSGARGGESLGVDGLAALGVVVTGRLTGFAGRYALFAADLDHELRAADRRMHRALGHIDRHIEQTRAAAAPADVRQPVSLLPGPRSLDLGAGIRTVLWATGFARVYPWLEVPVLDAAGELVHREGVTAAPGLFALGLRFQRTRRSHFLGGVGEDAAQIAEAILAGSRPARLPHAA